MICPECNSVLEFKEYMGGSGSLVYWCWFCRKYYETEDIWG